MQCNGAQKIGIKKLLFLIGIILVQFPQVISPASVERWKDGTPDVAKSAFIRLAEKVSHRRSWDERDDSDLAVVKENGLLEQKFWHYLIGEWYLLPSAARFSTPLVVKKLLEAGACANMENIWDPTSLGKIIRNSYSEYPQEQLAKCEVISLLLKARDKEGNTLLHVVAMQGDPNTVSGFLKHVPPKKALQTE